MYEAFFGFHQRPFAAAPLANCYFPAASVDASRQAMVRCLERGAGAALVIGAPGLGKSLLLQVLAGHFAEKMIVVSLAGAQLQSRRELLQAILFELQLPYRGLEEGELRLALVDHLTRSDKCPQGILLLVDEAQSLPTLLLEELRMMTNLARAGEPRMRLVLAGSLELEEIFARPELQAFNQRLAARCYLEPFDRSETIDYLRFQVAVAGGQAERVFSGGALDAVYRATDGIPRLVNQLCDHALTLAYQAERRPLEAKDIEIAWADLQQLPSPWQHEHAAGPEPVPTLEFGELDDEPWGNEATSVRLAPLPNEAATVWPAEAAGHDAVEERIELDFSGEFAQPVIPTRGLRIVEDSQRLEVVVDPFGSLRDDEEEDNPDGKDVAIPVEPPGWSRLPPAEQAALGRMVRQAAGDVEPSLATVPPQATTSQDAMLAEEVVTDRYAALDALQPPPSVLVASPPPEPTSQRANTPNPTAEGRLTLAEAIRLRNEAETAAAEAHALVEPDDAVLGVDPLQSLAARLPAQAATMSWLNDSATLVLDPTQLPPGAVIDVSGPDLTSDIVVIDDVPAGPAPSANEPVHRVERKDYKSLFARLRRG